MLFTDPTLVDELKVELAETIGRVSKLQARQLVILNQLQRAGVAGQEGARSMVDWAATSMDITSGSAREMVIAANRMYRSDPLLFEDLEAGDITLDRAMATLRLAGTDAPARVVDKSFGLDLTKVSRLTHQYRRITRKDDRQTFADRHFVIQPSLDESRWRGWFELPGADGHIVDNAIGQRADEIRMLPGGDQYSRTQRQADALVMISQDSLEAEGTTGGSGDPNVTVFVDLDQANGTGGELGAAIQYGPRIGPAVLEEIVCGGSIQLVGLQDGKPVVTSDNTKVIPPAVRSFVAWRDGGCAISGCTSRYRLQPHHLRHRAHDGDHDPDNLVTVCWFHHHVAIHGSGFRLEPGGPPGCRRLVGPNRGHDPP